MIGSYSNAGWGARFEVAPGNYRHGAALCPVHYGPFSVLVILCISYKIARAPLQHVLAPCGARGVISSSYAPPNVTPLANLMYRYFSSNHVLRTVTCRGQLFNRETPIKQGVALMGRNTTGPPCSVGRPIARDPGGRPTARPPAVLQTTTDDRRRQTPASKTILAH